MKQMIFFGLFSIEFLSGKQNKVCANGFFEFLQLFNMQLLSENYVKKIPTEFFSRTSAKIFYFVYKKDFYNLIILFDFSQEKENNFYLFRKFHTLLFNAQICYININK